MLLDKWGAYSPQIIERSFTMETAITAAQAAGVSNVTLAVGAIIAIAAVVLGVGIIKGLLSK